MHPYRRGRLSGFTLIELMIVVAILGILAAIAIPALTGSNRNGPAGQTSFEAPVQQPKCTSMRFNSGNLPKC